MTTETIDIRIREDGSRVVKRNLEDIGNTAEKSAGGVDILKRALIGIAGYLGFQQIRALTSAWTDLNSRVRLAAGGMDQAGAVMNRLQDIARRSYASIESISEIYLRNATALNDLGYSTQIQLDFTEAMTNALVISGAKAQQMDTVINALSKSMMEGTLRGQNWTTVLQQGDRVVSALADGLGVSVDELRRMAEAGELTSDKVMPALVSQLERLREEADSMPATIDDAFTVLRNRLMEVIGTMSDDWGFADAIVMGIDLVADNLELLLTVLMSVGAAVAVAFAPAAITAFATAVKGLFALVAAHPFAALAAAVGFAIMYLIQFGDELNAGIDDMTSIKDVMRAFGEEALAIWDALTDADATFFDWILGIADRTYRELTETTEDATANWTNSYRAFYSDVGTGFAGVVRGIARTVDAIAGLLTGLGIAIVRTFSGLPDVLGEVFRRAYNAVVEQIENIVNATIRGMNRLRGLVGRDAIDLINIERKAVDEEAFRQYGQNIAASIDAGFAMQGGFMENWVNGVFDRAQEIGRRRIAEMGGDVDLGSGTGGGRAGAVDPKELAKQQRELERLRNEFQSLLGTIAPIEAAQLGMARAQDTLNQALAKGIITTEDHARYMGLLEEHYKDILDPLSKLNRELDEQISLLGMHANEREVESQVLAYSQQLQQQGIRLTEEETEALRAKLKTLQDLNAVVREQDALLAQSVGKRQQFADQILAIQNLLADPNSGFTREDGLRALEQQMPDMFAGTQEAMELQLSKHREMYDQIEQMRQADLISEQTAAQMKARADIEYAEARLGNMRTFFGSLATLSQSENRKIAAIGRAAAITQATIDGVLAVQKALASAPPPVNFALAAAVGASAAANVAQIAGLGFQTGGQFTVGGSGGADSQLVAFRASPGEQVRVDNPRQVRKGDEPGNGKSEQSAPPQLNVKNINVLDPSLVGDYLATDEGEQMIMNVVQRNQRSLAY